MSATPNRFSSSKTLRKLGIACACAAALEGVPAGRARAQADTLAIARPGEGGHWHAVDRSPLVAMAGARRIVRLAEHAGEGLLWSDSLHFDEGEIDVDVRGRDGTTRNLLGIAFDIASDSAYDVVSLQPSNFRAADSAARARAIRYESRPAQRWERWRVEHPGAYEGSVASAPDSGKWIHLRIVVQRRELRAYVNGAVDPVLRVPALAAPTGGGVGLWVGDSAAGEFANLEIRALHGYTAYMSLSSAERDMKEEIRRVAPHVYMIHAPMAFGPAPLANQMLVEQRDGLVLIDAGKTRGAGERIVRLIRSVSAKPVKAVIVTHWHPDHVMGLGPVMEAWPSAIVISSALTRDHLLTDESYRNVPRVAGQTRARDSSRAQALRQYANEYGPYLHDPSLSEAERRGWANVVGVLDLRIADERGSYLVVPGVVFTHRYVIDDPDAPVEALAIGPSHTDGDIVAWTPKQRVVGAGDMVVAPIPYGGTNVLAWPQSLGRLEALGPRVIVPGHGEAEYDTRYVDRMIDALNAMNAGARRLAADSALSDEQVASRIDLSVERKRFAGDDRWLAYWFDQYFAPNAVQAYHELTGTEAH